MTTSNGHGSPLLQFQARPHRRNTSRSPSASACTFGNDTIQFTLHAGGCVRLHGPSGLGKTSLAMHIAGLLDESILRHKLGVHVEACKWDPSLPDSQRCGVLFQQTTLLDELTVAGNLCVALAAANKSSQPWSSSSSSSHWHARVKQLLDTVGLDYARDAHKRPSELSGGMARRASLALQLAQQKHVIVLDEPFAGLDHDAAVSVARELVHLRNEQKTALILISHEPDIADIVMDPNKTSGNVTITLEPPKGAPSTNKDNQTSSTSLRSASLFGTSFRDRVLERLVDYLFYSLPLILLAFAASGLAIAMLSADLLQRIDVSERILTIVDEQVKPLIQLFTGTEPNALTMLGINAKVRSMIDSTMPEARAKLFSIGMAKLFVLEIGPLLTALLLAGRIGGSYAGKVATMQATAQNKLLRTLGISPVAWTLWPSLWASLLAAPLLTAGGTVLALALGALVGQRHSIIRDGAFYWNEVQETVFPDWRLTFPPATMERATDQAWLGILRDLGGMRTTFSDSAWDTFVEIVTYPAIFHLIKAVTFMAMILSVAEVSGRYRTDLTPRGVPLVITSSVVLGSLLVILADWGFSQVYLQRV